jgi:branched-chain amino acid transport system substrate-binding protein
MLRNLLKAMLCAGATFVLVGATFAEDAVKVGVTQPLTGAFAADGNYVAQGAKLAAETINKAGGIDGKQIQLVVEDNKSNPTEAAATAERLIVEDKVLVMLGAWGSSLTLAVMPKLLEYKVPMVVETSSSGKITTSGNPYIFRISPTSEMEAKAFAPLVKTMGIKKADFLATNDDFGKGSMQEFTKMLKANGVEIGASETMGEDATDLSAQLAKIKASGGDTIFVTTDVKQLTLILKQAKDQQVTARIITTGGSVSPDQLIEQAGDAANGSYHLVFFTPWFPDAVKNPEAAKAFMNAWKTSNYDAGGLTEGFRGWDGVYTIAAAIQDAGGKVDAESIAKALWGVNVKGVNGDIAFIKQGPAGKESGQSVPSVYLVKIDGGKVVKQ